MLPTVTITPAAAKFINRIVRFSGMPAGAGLRLAVTPGGCSGYSSEFSPEAAPAAGEQLLEVGGVRLFLAAEVGVTKIDVSSIGRGRPSPVVAH